MDEDELAKLKELDSRLMAMRSGLSIVPEFALPTVVHAVALLVKAELARQAKAPTHGE